MPKLLHGIAVPNKLVVEGIIFHEVENLKATQTQLLKRHEILDIYTRATKELKKFFFIKNTSVLEISILPISRIAHISESRYIFPPIQQS